jgi:alkylation response protein AidB-like acyl-CoA dehydrogenase
MYSFEPNEEQKMLVDSIHRYAVQDLRQKAHDADEEASLPSSLIEKGWEMGYLQASIPEQYGGFGERSSVTGVLAAEEMAWGDLSAALAVLSPGLFVIPLLLAGSEEQKREYIPEVIEAEWKPFTAGLVEPHFDFDANELRTTAAADDGAFVISGEKAFVPFANQAEAMIVYASLEGKPQGFIVPRGIDGVRVGERQKLMGINALPVYRVCFERLRIPKDHLLGGAQGHAMQPILDASRLAMAAMAIGLSRAAFEYARDYAKERDVFGMKVAQKQAIAFMLAEMATEIEAIRLLTWEAAWMTDAGKSEASKHAYLALTGAMDMAMMVTDRAVQILGGHGYIREHPVELWMRNGRGIATANGMAII